MNPRIIAISGPLRGSTFKMPEGELTIGRDPANSLVIPDQALSRRHCVIREEEGQLELLDLASRNGSFVNGIPIREKSLEHGDQIEIGESLLLFLLRDDEGSPLPNLPILDEGGSFSFPTTRLRREERADAELEKVHLPLPARNTRDLNALLKISTTINSIQKLDLLERRLLESIFEVVPAERGAVLLARGNQDDFGTVSAIDRFHGAERPVRIARHIIHRVLRERAPILSHDVSAGGGQGLITSLLAVPLLVLERLVGAIYLDTSDVMVRFDDDHLQLLTSIAAFAAPAVDNLRQIEWLASENQRLQAEMKIEHNMVGESSCMRAVHHFIAKAGPLDSTVLIRGESGTGKELVARALHLNSRRAPKPFVAINCASLTEPLLESELFGHERGAFTGAVALKMGMLEVADGGTVFLDEVSELAPVLQAKLLRVLQEREFNRVGGTLPIKVDIRLIAATNRDIDQSIRNGRFRQDLYFRLNVISITVPPLRERREDIPLLARYFAAKYSKKCNRHVVGLSREARACLEGYDWPGNVRELENAVERAVALGTGDLIRPEDLPEEIVEVDQPQDAPAQASSTRYHEALKETKKRLILQAVDQAKSNYTEAARLLGVHPNYLHRLIRNLNLKAELKK
jgi:transcriptional regulator with GAF, ATPase, and Fis domain